MSFEYEVNEKNLKFIHTGLTGRMKQAVSLGVRDSLAIMEVAHKKLFVLGQSKDPTTYPFKLVWRTGALAKSYMMSWKAGDLHGYYGSTLKRSGILERGGTIRPKNAKALRFKIGNQWVTTKKVEIKGRFMMTQVEKNESVMKRVEKKIADAFVKGADHAG